MFLHVASHNVQVDILALQETWRLPFTETIQITGYQFIHQHRSANRGGGGGGGGGFKKKSFKYPTPAWKEINVFPQHFYNN